MMEKGVGRPVVGAETLSMLVLWDDPLLMSPNLGA